MSQTVLQLLTFHQRRVTKISVVGVTTVLTQRVIVLCMVENIMRALSCVEIGFFEAWVLLTANPQ